MHYKFDVDANNRLKVSAIFDYFQDAAANHAENLKVGYTNLWLLFDTYLDAVGEECTKLTEEKWVGKLAAVDVFTKSHCDKLVESLRID